MRALLIAYYFPPDGGPGAQRPISFARHLPGHGIACTVLTRTPPARRGMFDPADEAALARVEPCCRIVRAAPATAMPEVLRNLTAAGDAAIADHRPDVVLVTMSPFELWRTADELGRRHGLPVVFDLRDPWALDGVVDYRTRWHWRREFAEMRRMLRAADGVVANTPECRGLFLGAEPQLDPARVAVVTNGWDADDFPAPLPDVEPGPVLRLLHGGSFLCHELYVHERPLRRLLGWLRHSPEPLWRSGRTPRHLLGAIRRLRERGASAGAEVRFCAMGQADEALRRCVAESGVADAVELLGYQPHATVTAALRSADALFLTLHGLPPGHRSRIVPGKTYEYLASGRPILAGLPAGDAREFVAASPRGFVADPCDETALADRLVELHARWRAGEFRHPERPADIDTRERNALAGELASFLRRVAAAGRRDGTRAATRQP
ncbi:MAG: glycosyltransferase [Planctomycetes bacterium]|nr:glycosyltransferase [Planctomycetota bacterium]